jgi:hypothetical protein
VGPFFLVGHINFSETCLRTNNRPRTFGEPTSPQAARTIRPQQSLVAQDANLAVTRTGARSVEHARLAGDGLAGRKPMLLLRLSGLLSLRFAERRPAGEADPTGRDRYGDSRGEAPHARTSTQESAPRDERPRTSKDQADAPGHDPRRSVKSSWQAWSSEGRAARAARTE